MKYENECVLQQDEADSHRPGLHLSAEVLQSPVVISFRLCQANQSLFFLLHQPQEVSVTFPVSSCLLHSSLYLTNRLFSCTLSVWLLPLSLISFLLSPYSSLAAFFPLCDYPMIWTCARNRDGSVRALGSVLVSSDAFPAVYVIESNVTYLSISPNRRFYIYRHTWCIFGSMCLLFWPCEEQFRLCSPKTSYLQKKVFWKWEKALFKTLNNVSKLKPMWRYKISDLGQISPNPLL